MPKTVTSNVKFPFVFLFALLAPLLLHAQGGVGPKTLFDPASPSASKQVTISNGEQVSTSIDKNGLTVHIKAGEASYPGITLKSENGAPWNLALYGHVEAKLTNTGSKKAHLNLRVDNPGDYTLMPWNWESKNIDPGQTKIIRVYFGYAGGFHPSFKMKPEAITELLFYTEKTKDEISFRIENVQGAGWVGEKVGVDPDRVARKPANGVLLDASTVIQPTDQISTYGDAKGTVGPDGKFLQIDFAGGREESVTFKPVEGLWNLNEAVEVKLKVKNVGQTPVTPSAQVESETGPTDTIAASAPLVPGAETEIIIPFAAKVPWLGIVDPVQLDPHAKGSWWGAQPGTGTPYRSNATIGITLLSDKTAGAKSLLVTSILADLPPLTLPPWLGQKPPVEGDWVQTLNENFDGNSIDLHRWNVHAINWWDKRMHFSKDQVIVKDGFLALRMEKKSGYHNDDATGKTESSGAKTDYATGQVDTYGKWTQRYGYFEIREKQPTAKCLWPGFWMTPDRGQKAGDRDKRETTENGGMEFDITESQSSWGIHRFNIACHWDGYGDKHKSLGTSSNYVQADKDGFIVVGLLWTPGSYVVYGNGKEIFRWESPRITSVPVRLILQNEIGGWDNEAVDDAQFPADYVIDYIRVWQRKDLASPEDGPKPNRGDYDAFH